jgi:PBP1b-binding outer membrane lipoprotein LpoB
MKTKLSLLLTLPSLAILLAGCSTGSNATYQDPWPTFPAFTHDTSPDPPNFYWMFDRPDNSMETTADLLQEARQQRSSTHNEVVGVPTTSP